VGGKSEEDGDERVRQTSLGREAIDDMDGRHKSLPLLRGKDNSVVENISRARPRLVGCGDGVVIHHLLPGRDIMYVNRRHQRGESGASQI
jgi:hypothetical protein